MKKIITTFAFIFLFSGALFAQVNQLPPDSVGEFKFDEEIWAFRNIPQNKPVTHYFRFTNIGKSPIAITDCRTTCGCVSLKWTKEPILPGMIGNIEFTYNAAHVGEFHKVATILYTAKTAIKMISIEGNVIAAPVEQTNVDSMGEFKFDEQTWDFGNIPTNKQVTHHFRFTNTGNKPIMIHNCLNPCGCMVVDWTHEPILPGKTGEIKVIYNAGHVGGFNKSVTIESNTKTSPNTVTIKGKVVDVPAEETTPVKTPSPFLIQPK